MNMNIYEYIHEYIYIYMTSSSYNHTLNGNTKWQVMRIYHELRLKSNLIQV